MTSMQHKTLIFTTFRNEADVLPEFIKRCAVMADGMDCDFDLLLLDDHSSDDSYEIVSEFVKDHDIENILTVRYVRTLRRFGVAPCVLFGFKEAKDYQRVVYLDTDLQDPPELIPEMIKRHNDGFEIVHTRRLSRAGESRLKMGLTGLAYSFIDNVNGFNSKNMGDFKLLDRSVIEHVTKVSPKDPYVRGMTQWLTGFATTVVDYDREERASGDSKFKLTYSINPYLELFRGLFSFSGTPLVIVGLAAALSSMGLTAVIFGILVLKVFGVTSPGWATLAFIPSFVGSLTLIVLATLCIYVARMYDELTKFKEVIAVEKTLGSSRK